MGFETSVQFTNRVFDLKPYECNEIMLRILRNKRIQEDVNSYSKKLQSDKIKHIPLPLTKEYLLKNEEPSLSMQNSLFLQNFMELYNYALQAYRAKSILYYYSWNSFLAFLVYSFLRYDRPSEHHGMTVYGTNIYPSKLSKFGINFIKRNKPAFLHRVIDLFTVLGYPIAIADLIPIIKKDGLSFTKNDISTLNKMKISFEDIINFDIDEFVNKYRSKYFDDKHNLRHISIQSFKHINKGILSYLIVFIASNYERYKPHFWSVICEGTDQLGTIVNKKTKQSYENYVTYMFNINNILKRLELVPIL